MASSSSPEEHVSVIRCPACGKTSDFKLIERADIASHVLGICREGYVEVDGRPVIEERAELGVEAKFECRNVDDGTICLHRWPLPDWLIRRLVYY